MSPLSPVSSSPAAHLVRRFVGSLSRRPPSATDDGWASDHLLASEVELWRQMATVDRRHAIEVTRRFAGLRVHPSRAEMAGALLHDVGKVVSRLGTISRVLATVIGPRTKRFRSYHDHERLGAEMLRSAGSSPATIELVQRRGPAAPALAAADQT